MFDSPRRTRIATLILIAVLCPLVAGCGGSSDTTTGASVNTSAENTTKDSGAQGGSRKGNTPSKSGSKSSKSVSAKKSPATNDPSRKGTGRNEPTRSSLQTRQQKKPSSTGRTAPPGVSHNSHKAGSSQQPAGTNPHGGTHGNTHYPPPPQAEPGSGGH